MKLLTSFVTLMLVGLALAAPASKDDDTLTITKNFYNKEFIKYSADHEIVKLLLPINSINFDDDDSSESKENSSSDENETDIILFFVEADIDDNGKYIDQGLYSLINGTAKKLLDHGRDAATDNSTNVFFGAKDGIYIFNKEKNSAEKYGTIDDSVIAIAVVTTGDVIYILTEDNDLFKVTDKGTKKEKVEDVVKAKEIVLDYANNLYFYSDDKQAYVRTADGVKKIEGLPENPKSLTLVRPPFVFDTGVPIIVDTRVFIIYPNETSEDSGIEFKPKAKPSAYSPEAVLIQYYAHDKKIYEFNILAMILGDILDELKNFLNDKTEDIRSLSKKKNFRKST